MFLNDIAKHGLYVVLNITAQAELIRVLPCKLCLKKNLPCYLCHDSSGQARKSKMNPLPLINTCDRASINVTVGNYNIISRFEHPSIQSN